VPWLLRNGEVLATLEVAESLVDRARGLLGRDGIDGALLLRPARAVHTIGMRFPIDVALCDGDLVVITTMSLERYRVCLPRVRARAAVEAEAGAFERWNLRTGDQLEIKG
jgi:uncharacterized membrane protein (UPF0127 family)